MLGDNRVARVCRVSHSTSAIVKPQQKMDSVGAREIEEAMKKVKEAQSLITAAVDPGKERVGGIREALGVGRRGRGGGKRGVGEKWG